MPPSPPHFPGVLGRVPSACPAACSWPLRCHGLGAEIALGYEPLSRPSDIAGVIDSSGSGTSGPDGALAGQAGTRSPIAFLPKGVTRAPGSVSFTALFLRRRDNWCRRRVWQTTKQCQSIRQERGVPRASGIVNTTVLTQNRPRT